MLLYMLPYVCFNKVTNISRYCYIWIIFTKN
nr:MAG TPA: hypothetical protein [Caudoviricetes sp.]